MMTSKETKQLTSRALQHYALLASFYTILIFILPPNPSNMRAYHLSAIDYRVAMFAVALPALAAWLAVILSSIALQYTGSVGPGVGHLVFNYKLALTSFFRIIGGGFILLALGASRLKKIEEV